jgi:GNAT superfamily N-acetyltransferase
MPKNERERLTAKERNEKNFRVQRKLVERGCSHGILVYSNGEPIGWCQYGPREELPRIDHGFKYRKICLDSEGGKMWRITCFCVDKKYRNRGVASAGLHAAMNSIRKKRGELAEAYPTTRKGPLAAHRGTVSMFKNEGFKLVAPFGKTNVLMRRTL